MKMRFLVALPLAFVAGCDSLTTPSGDWEAKRAAMVNRKREVIYSTDGCDALYYPTNRPATKAEFIDLRLKYTRGGKIDTVYYTPQAAGFCHLIYDTVAGDVLTNDATSFIPSSYNVTRDLLAQGTSPVKIAEEYCKAEGLEFFVTLRVNDTHDAGKPLSFLYPKFKEDHPEFLFGQPYTKVPYGAWSAVDFAHPEVRQRLVNVVAEICAKFDVDGVDLDFFRHLHVFRTVAVGADAATPEEVEVITGMMREIRAATEKAGHKRGRPVLLSVRVPDSIEYSRALGLDWEEWMQEHLIDMIATTGYFQQKQWPESIGLAHKYGVKHYASMDESRIERHCKGAKQPLPVISGRNSPESYRGRTAAALASGSDGILYFNLEGKQLNETACGNMKALDGADKLYFAVERGMGGYRPEHYLKDGFVKYNAMPDLDPGRGGKKVKFSEEYVFDMMVGEDTAKAPGNKKARVLAKVLADSVADVPVKLTVNGRAVPASGHDKENAALFDVPADVVKFGSNRIGITVGDAARKGDAAILDFCLRVSYR